MSIWGNLNLDTAFTIKLYRKDDVYSRKPYKRSWCSLRISLKLGRLPGARRPLLGSPRVSLTR